MARTFTGIWWSPTAEGTPALVATAAFFTLGGLAGCFLAFRVTGAGIETMTAYLDRFLETARSGGLNIPELPELLWRSLRWPLAAFLLGFSALGLLGIPALCSMRGFFLAFSISSFAQAYGQQGLAIAFILLGIPGLLSIPSFMLLTTQSFSTACVLAGRSGWREGPFRREHFFRCGVCAAAVCVSLLMERYLVPVLMTGAVDVLLR